MLSISSLVQVINVTGMGYDIMRSKKWYIKFYPLLIR